MPKISRSDILAEVTAKLATDVYKQLESYIEGMENASFEGVQLCGIWASKDDGYGDSYEYQIVLRLPACKDRLAKDVVLGHFEHDKIAKVAIKAIDKLYYSIEVKFFDWRR